MDYAKKIELLLERFEEARRIKRRKRTTLTYEQIFSVCKNIPFIHGTNFRNFEKILNRHKLLSFKELIRQDPTVRLDSGNTYELDWYFKTVNNVFFSYGKLVASSDVIFLLKPKEALKLNGYIQMDDVSNIWGKHLDEISKKMFHLEKEEGIPVGEMPIDYINVDIETLSYLPEETLKKVKNAMVKKRISIPDFIKLTSYLMLRYASKHKINNLTTLIKTYLQMGKRIGSIELHIKKEVSIDNINLIIINERFKDEIKFNLNNIKHKLEYLPSNIISKIYENPMLGYRGVVVESIINESLITESPYDSPNKKHIELIKDKKFLKILRREILSRLFNGLIEYFKDDPEYCKYLQTCLKNYSKSIKIIGGFLTKFAKKDSDVDVNVFLKDDILIKINSNKEKAIKKIHEWFYDNINDKSMENGYDYVINYFFLKDNDKFKNSGIQLFGDDIKKKEIENKLDEYMVDVTQYLSYDKFNKYIFTPMKKASLIIKKMLKNKNLNKKNLLKKIYSITERVGGEIFPEFEKFHKDLKVCNYTADNLRFKAMKEKSDFYTFVKLCENKKYNKLKKWLDNKNWKLNLSMEKSLTNQIMDKVIKNKIGKK